MTEIPRCSHGHILLACPRDDCPEQDAYVSDFNARMDEHYERQRAEARRLVRAELGLPDG